MHLLRTVILSLVLAMAMLFASILAMPASAHDDAEAVGEFRVISIRVLREGYTYAESSLGVLISCTHPNTEIYKVSHDPHSVNEYCVVVVREYCPHCGWSRDIECIGVGDHHPYYTLPYWPY